MTNASTSRNKKQTKKALSAKEKQVKLDKRRATNRKAQKKFSEKNRRFILATKKMNSFLYDVVATIRKCNGDQYALLIQLDEQWKQWEKIEVKFTFLQSMVLCYANATSVLVSKRFLEEKMKPRIIDLGEFRGAKRFFDKHGLLWWRMTAPPAQSLVDQFCSLNDHDAKMVRPSLVIFTALLCCFCEVFPLEPKYSLSFLLNNFKSGSGVVTGDEDDLEADINESTFHEHYVPKNPGDYEEI